MQRMPRAAVLDDERVLEPERTAPIRRRRDPYVVGSANDAAERRADQVADRGLAILNARATRLPATASVPTTPSSRVQRSTRPTVGLEGGAVDDDTARSIDGAMGAGRAFEPDVARRVEMATSHDVGDVRVHTDARADRLARSMQASAFTVNRNVFFAAGEYRPDTAAGMHTVLHESAHDANAGLFNGGKKLAQPPAPRKDTNPWELMGGRKMLYH